MIRRFVVALASLVVASAALGQQYNPGYVPFFRPGFQFSSGTPQPVFQANFTQLASLPSQVSFSRNSAATYIGPDGLLKTATADVPRFDYDPATLMPRGLLIEEQRSGAVSRDLTHMAWVKTGAAAALDQTGIDGGANTASSLTALTANATALLMLTIGSSQRVQSVYVKRLSGSGAVAMTMDGGATWTAVTVTASWTRVTIPAQTLANPTIGVRLATSGDAVAIDYMQNEGGSFATSALPPAAAPTTIVTRAGEIVPISGAALSVLKGDAYTIIVESTDAKLGSGGQLVFVGDSTGAPYFAAATAAGIFTYNPGQLFVPATPTLSLPVRVAMARDSAGRSIVANGGTVATDANVPVVPSNVQISTVASSMNGHMARIAIYSARLPNGVLQQKSVVGASF